MNWIVGALAIGAAFDVAQRSRQLRGASARQRLVVGAGAALVAVGLAAVATPLLDALDISGPNLQIGAGLVLGVYALVALVTWDDAPPPDPTYGGGVVPLLFPIVLTPAVGVVVMAVAARNGMLVPTLASVAAAAVLAWPASSVTIGRRSVRMLSAAIGVVAAVAMIVDGAFAV